MAVSWRAAVLAAVGVVVVVALPSTTTVWAWLGLVAVVCLVDAAAAVSPRGLALERRVSGPVRAGTRTWSEVVLTNPGRRGVRVEVRDAWPPSSGPSPSRHVVGLAGHSRVSVRTALTPARRGTRRADLVTVRAWGPLGLAARQASIAAPLTLAVLPEFRSRRLLPSRLERLHELEGSAATILRGPGTEFDSLREYVRGDDPRDIDWRASARSRDLVVRTWRPERDRHVVLVLDTGRASALLLGSTGGAPADEDGPLSAAPAGHTAPESDMVGLGAAPRLDAGIEAALLLAALADRAGDNVHVLALDRTVRARVSGVRGTGLMGRIARALVDVGADLQPIDWDLVVAEVRRTVHHPGLVVLLTEVPPAGADPDFQRAVADLARRHVVVVASARDPELARLAAARGDAASVYAAAAAAAVVREVEAGDRDATRSGAVVLDVDAGLLAARLADTYLALKVQGRL